MKNLKARAENGSLLSIRGFVVIKADDQRIIKINGNILFIIFYRHKSKVKSYKFILNLNYLLIESIEQIT